MRILFFHQFYKTPEEGGGIRSFYIVDALIKKGHEVIVISSNSSLEKNKAEKLDSANQLSNPKIIRLPVSWSNSMSFFGRLKTFFQFLLLARKESKKHQFDMVYAISVPLTTGLLAMWTKKPFVFEVGDLWPDVPVQMKILKNPVLKYFSYRLEKKIYKKARLIISLSEDIKRHIYQKWPYTANIIVENFSDTALFGTRNKQSMEKIETDQVKITNSEFRKEKSDEIVCTYVGTAGMANELMQMVDLAKFAEKGYPQISFYMMLDGKYEDKIKKSSPSNMYFIDYGNKQRVAELLAICDFNFVCYAQYPLLGTGSPNKFFDGIAAGCITVINVPGWIEKLILNEKAGLFWEVSKPDELLSSIKKLTADSDIFEAYKSNSKSLASRFDKELLCQKIVEQIELRF